MTETTSKPKIPTWYWVASILGLIWNLMGVSQYIAQAYMTDDQLSQLTLEEQQMYADLPSWYIACFALAVFSGAIGCFALVFKKKLAYPFLLVSLLFATIQMSYVAFVLKMANPMTPLIILVGIGLVYLSKVAIKKQWIS
ncbi:MAG: hypothetical protein BM564_12230 [Bacteroidetes bacterium MedPE-SWsnd-G2]|nr:MAG: hypothetical protein BM564_12230 [Bacteroidetes bacterium MedPE-SWsnd-G2]